MNLQAQDKLEELRNDITDLSDVVFTAQRELEAIKIKLCNLNGDLQMLITEEEKENGHNN